MPARFRWDNFVLDLDGFRLERGGVPLALEPKAFNLLALMVRRPDHLFSKQEIFDAIWPDTAVTDHALTRVIAQIRRVLGDEAREARYLETVPTRGYRWIHPVEAVSAAAPVVAPPIRPAAPRRRRISPLAAGAAVTAAVVLSVLLWQRHEAASGSEPLPERGRRAAASDSGDEVRWPVQVTTTPGLDLHPALSPHADAVAFVSDRTGSFEIYVRALDGTATDMPLTSDGAQNVQPAWSADGKFLAYHSYRRGGIWVIPSRGGTPRQVVAEGSRPAWSPDGARIAYQSDEHADASPYGYGAQSGSTIKMVDADGTHVTDLTRNGAPAGGHASPAWSPDGRYVSFTVFDAGPGNGVWLLTRQTGATIRLQAGDALFESVFSRDGSTIYVAGGDALIARLRFDPASGTVTGAREVIPVPGVPGVRGLSVSPDGSRLAFAGLGLSSQIWAQRMTRDGAPVGDPRALTSDTSRRNSLPAISPDGTRVAYKSSRQGEQANLWLMQADGSRPTQLTSDTAFESQPEWFPDGDRIAYRSRGDEDEGLRFVDVATRKTAALVGLADMRRSSGPVPLAGQLAELRLSRSTARVAFSMRVPPGGNRVLYVSRRDVLSPRALTDPAVSAGYPAWSPDERSIAIEIKDGSSTNAAVVDTETGVLRRLTSARGQTWVRSWSPDGRQIAAAVLRDGQWSLRALDAASGAERAITAPEPPRVYVRFPDWSPRGDLVVFERAEMTGNIWLIAVR